jgi:hypothetical protein
VQPEEFSARRILLDGDDDIREPLTESRSDRRERPFGQTIELFGGNAEWHSSTLSP